MFNLVKNFDKTLKPKSFLIFCEKSYAIKSGSLGKKRFRLPVESDAKKLVNYVCGSNIFKEGEDVKIKDDSEYPDWIWEIKIDSRPTHQDFDQNSKEYWQFLEFRQMIKRLRLLKSLPKEKMVVNEKLKLNEKHLNRIKMRLLMDEDELDPGWNPKDILEEKVNPRIYLRPEISSNEVYLDQVNVPPMLDKQNFHYSMSKKKFIREDC